VSIQQAAPLDGTVIDTHTHLDVHDRSLHGASAPTPDELIESAASVGVDRVVQIGCDVPSARFSADYARDHPNVAAGVAIHPNDIARIHERDGIAGVEQAWAVIAELAALPQVCAVGETGLDYYRTKEPGRPIQQESFRWHIDLAKRLGKTLVIHDRDSHEDVIAILDHVGAPDRVVFHCFSGDVAMAHVCAERGWYMSFAGVVTYPSAQGLRDALRVVPEDLVLVETDAPYLTPVPNRGKANASALMPFTVRAMAKERDLPERRMCEVLTANAERAFRAW
jgi:TatD DNase family protein